MWKCIHWKYDLCLSKHSSLLSCLGSSKGPTMQYDTEGASEVFTKYGGLSF